MVDLKEGRGEVNNHKALMGGPEKAIALNNFIKEKWPIEEEGPLLCLVGPGEGDVRNKGPITFDQACKCIL